MTDWLNGFSSFAGAALRSKWTSVPEDENIIRFGMICSVINGDWKIPICMMMKMISHWLGFPWVSEWRLGGWALNGTYWIIRNHLSGLLWRLSGVCVKLTSQESKPAPIPGRGGGDKRDWPFIRWSREEEISQLLIRINIPIPITDSFHCNRRCVIKPFIKVSNGNWNRRKRKRMDVTN